MAGPIFVRQYYSSYQGNKSLNCRHNVTCQGQQLDLVQVNQYVLYEYSI